MGVIEGPEAWVHLTLPHFFCLITADQTSLGKENLFTVTFFSSVSHGEEVMRGNAFVI